MFNISNKIKSTARSSGGRLDSLAKFLIDYIETGDEALLIASDDISFTGMSSLCDMSNFDYSGFSWSDKESRLLKLALRRAKRNFADPEKYLKPFHWEEFGSSVFQAAGYIMYHREAFRNDHLFDGFLDDLKDAGIPDGHIFGWITSGGEELKWAGWFKSDFGTNHEWKTGFEQYVWNLPDDVLFPPLRRDSDKYHPLIMALARYRPETIRRWVVHLKSHLDPGIGRNENILIDLLGLSEEFDSEIVEIMTHGGNPSCLYRLHRLRPDSYSEPRVSG